MKVYNKLVRDRIPEIIEKSGKKANYKVLNKEAYRLALKAKLIEEVNEFLAAKTKKQMKEELADIREVFITILYEYKLSDYYKIHFEKGEEKGGFFKRYFLESVEEEL